jgi:hypothetical protein
LISWKDFSIYLGNFGRAEIKERLAEKGYQKSSLEGYTLFTKEAGDYQFAIKSDDTLLKGTSEAILRELIRQKSSQNGADSHPTVIEFLPHLEGTWGALMTPSGDPSAVARQFQAYCRIELSEFQALCNKINKPGYEPQPGWDFMTVGEWGTEQLTITLNFLYHYPSGEEADKDVGVVRTALTDMPSLTSRSRLWGDKISLQSIEVHGNILKAVVGTTSKSLISSAIVNRDYSFLPIRNVQPDAPQVITSTLELGWILYELPGEGFAIALPPEWQQFVLDPETFEKGLGVLSEQDSKFKGVFSSQAMRSLMASGLKFFGMDLSPKALLLDYPVTANILKMNMGVELSPDDYVPMYLKQLEKIASSKTPITHRHVTLANVEAEEFKYSVEAPTAMGSTVSGEGGAVLGL